MLVRLLARFRFFVTTHVQGSNWANASNFVMAQAKTSKNSKCRAFLRVAGRFPCPPLLSVLCSYFAAQNILHRWTLELAVRWLVLADSVQKYCDSLFFFAEADRT